MYKAKLLSELPKEHGNGFDGSLLAEIAERLLSRQGVRPRVALVILEGEKAEAKADGTVIATLRASWVQPVLTPEVRRVCQQMLREEYLAADGAITLPFELDTLQAQTFGDLPRTASEVDDDQARERLDMTIVDELRRHLEVLHGVQDAEGLTAQEAHRLHDAEHADGGAAMDPLSRHAPDFIGWTRAELEAAQIVSEEYASVGLSEEDIMLAAAADAAAPVVGDDESSYRQDGESWAEEEAREAGANVMHVEFGGPR